MFLGVALVHEFADVAADCLGAGAAFEGHWSGSIGSDSELALLSRDQLNQTELMQELWRPVVGYEERYAVSSLGRIKRLEHTIPVTGHPKAGYVRRCLKERLLNPSVGNHGYRTVQLGKNNAHLVHQLVLIAFVGPRPEGYVACHGSNGKSDNSVDNLSWGTCYKNVVEDRERDGTFIWGAADLKSKLTEEQVRFIRQYKKQFTQQYMANLFGVDRKTVNDVLVGNTWTRLL